MTIAINFNPTSALYASRLGILRAHVRRLLLAAWTELESAGARRAARHLEMFAATKMHSDPEFARQLREAIRASATR